VSHAFARVILLTRDEYDMISDCLEYYSRMLGGRDRVIVIDNGSVHPTVLDAYEAHRAAGGHVVSDVRPFKDAVSFMSEHMKTWGITCDWLLPMETDEIVYDLAAESVGESVPVSPESVGAALETHLRGMAPNVGVVRYGKMLGSLVDPSDAGYVGGAYSRPILQMRRFYDQNWDKIIVRTSAFVRMRLWCHHATMRPGYVKVVSDRLGLLHFHDTGLRRQVERSVPVASSYGYIDPGLTDDEQLSKAMQLRDAPIACGHKVRYLADQPHASRHAARLSAPRGSDARVREGDGPVRG
jgi:hypothetical protein